MEHTDKIALIIPLRLTGSTYEGALRLARICEAVPRALFDVVISDYGTLPEHRAPIDALRDRGVSVVEHPSPEALFSIGKARDYGVQMSRAPVILFNDIDFLGTPEMYRAIHAEATARGLHRNLFDFFCVPVLFLTEQGTRRWLEAGRDDKPFAGRRLDVEVLEAASDDIQSVAYGSSAMVVNRHHYLSLGGHDWRFSGHGAEDYDLLHRLATLAPKGPRPHDYYTDYKNNGVRRYWGFRPLFALQGLEVLSRGVHLVHLWHPRRMEKGYFRPGRNFRLLGRVMRRFDRSGIQPAALAHLAGDGQTWYLLYRNRHDLDLLRQLLPFSTRLILVKVRSLGTPSTRRHLDDAGAGLVVVAPGVAGDAEALARALAPKKRVLRIAGPGPAGYDFSMPAEDCPATAAKPSTIVSPLDRAVFAYWPELSIQGLFDLRTGEIPRQEAIDAPLFATFGAEEIRDGSRARRPERKKKSPLIVRLRRWVTGY